MILYNIDNINITINIDIKLTNKINGDKIIFTNALSNIINNAFKFTSSGFISITINERNEACTETDIRNIMT